MSVPTDEERIEHVSDAYADVASALGIERLRLAQMYAVEPRYQDQVWRVERLERAHGHLRAALVGTPRERISEEQINALNEGSGSEER